jgi:hypothetical protein
VSAFHVTASMSAMLVRKRARDAITRGRRAA